MVFQILFDISNVDTFTLLYCSTIDRTGFLCTISVFWTMPVLLIWKWFSLWFIETIQAIWKLVNRQTDIFHVNNFESFLSDYTLDEVDQKVHKKTFAVPNPTWYSFTCLRSVLLYFTRNYDMYSKCFFNCK